jgi:competence protein ComEA
VTNADRLLAVGAAVALLVAGVAAWSLAASGSVSVGPLLPADSAGLLDADLGSAHPAPTPSAELVVDVEGAVLEPGIHRLTAGDRVADALAAAGGYAPDADLATSAHQLNLAAPLVDGQHIYVPRHGEMAAGGSGAGGDGLINLNSADTQALESLPGIGPVTARKIVAARAERPFASLEELVERGVMNRGQLEQIRELATVR